MLLMPCSLMSNLMKSADPSPTFGKIPVPGHEMVHSAASTDS